MAITEYEKDGIKMYKIYVQARGRLRKEIRLQKYVSGVNSLAAAQREEKKLLEALNTRVAKLEGKGMTWADLLYRWEVATYQNYIGLRYESLRTKEEVNRMKLHTATWMKRVASDLTRGDGRRLLELAKNKGASDSILKRLKCEINKVFVWGIEENLVRSPERVITHSPVYGIKIGTKKEKSPEILTLQEIRHFLFEAKLKKHPWYPHWAFAILSGMRYGELVALEWEDVDEANNIVRVTKSFNRKIRALKSTKNGCWRNVHVSPQLQEILQYIKNNDPDHIHVLKRLPEWGCGGQVRILRSFLKSIGINKPIKFHTLRACFATHLLATGAEPMKVMKMGGWSDLKTFQIYLRMAGIDVKGVSDALDILPKNNFENVISFQHS